MWGRRPGRRRGEGEEGGEWVCTRALQTLKCGKKTLGTLLFFQVPYETYALVD